MGAFSWLTPPGPYRATICQQRELTLDHIGLHTFWSHKDMETLPGLGISSIPGPSASQHDHEWRYTLVLVIGGGSPINESDLLVTSLPSSTSGSTANWFLTLVAHWITSSRRDVSLRLWSSMRWKLFGMYIWGFRARQHLMSLEPVMK